MASTHESHLHLEIGHILFLDIVGYSKLLADEQWALLQELKDVVRHTNQFRAAEAEGKLTRLPTGDGMVLVFTNNPEAPVECALEIARELRAHPTLKLRMGIHSGPVNPVADVNDQTNLAGAGINVAQRVVSCGDAGHILLSKHFAEDLEQYAHWQPYLHDIGEAEVKHGVRLSLVSLHDDELGNAQLPQKIARTHTAYRRKVSLIAGLALLGLVAVTYWSLRYKQSHTLAEAAASISAKSIAVLPFENRSSDKENAYFTDSIQDEILTRLSKIADLKVISRTSTQHYKSTPENLREIAKQLGVAHILEGSVQRSGDAVRVNVQLIKAATDTHAWGDTYDRKLTDIFSVQSDIAKAIVDRLRAKLTGLEEETIAAKPTDNAEAYDAYLRGLAYTLKPGDTPANNLGAQKYFRESVRLDPKFALAWALLSYTDSVGYLTTGLQPTDALREEARQAAETALTLQPNLGEAVLAQGQYHYACLKAYDTAVHYFERARQLLPNSSRIPEALAYVARRRGQWDVSESNFNEAERLDPRNVTVLTEHTLFYIALRRFAEALRKSDQVLDITPDDLDIIALQAGIAQAQGDLPRASALLTPLRPAARDIGVLGTQVYQAILERHPTQIIPFLKEMLATPDPASGNFNGALRFRLGWAQEVAGDHAAAEESWREARDEVEFFLKDQPENDMLIGDLALINMALNNKAAALTLAERAMAANPIEKDAIAGPAPIEILARVTARVGEPDRAIEAIQKLLSIPYAGPFGFPLTPALLRLDPMFDPLRNDPRFQKLVASPAPK
jgi:TolB-like protein